jgi:hypothetical protein
MQTVGEFDPLKLPGPDLQKVSCGPAPQSKSPDLVPGMENTEFDYQEAKGQSEKKVDGELDHLVGN